VNRPDERGNHDESNLDQGRAAPDATGSPGVGSIGMRILHTLKTRSSYLLRFPTVNWRTPSASTRAAMMTITIAGPSPRAGIRTR